MIEKLKRYVELFNEQDEEAYKNEIDNSHALEWLAEQIPLFECPDEDIERTYYFRYWTYRKHIKSTPVGYVITEFLPRVPWGGRWGEINAAAGHHIYEGRWLRDSAKYLKDYILFFLDNPERGHQYSTWLCYALMKLTCVTGDLAFIGAVLPKLCKYYELWEESHGLKCGMLWSVDEHDAMEFSISGSDERERAKRGIRPTLNSYMCADAYAIAHFASLLGESEIEQKYRQKHERLRALINDKLLEDGFYRAYHCYAGEDICAAVKHNGSAPREEIGYIPWMFNIPTDCPPSVFELLLDDNAFFTEYGIATAERTHPRFLYTVEHECLWNGYVWPFATSQTLYALLNGINSYGCERLRDIFNTLIKQYAASHTRVLPDGTRLPWIDEVRSPLCDDWSSRTLLREWGWREDKGGYERGKDYNHSTFCDLVISGIVGVCDTEELTVKPCIPSDWSYFRLSSLRFRGKVYDITYDEDGSRYGRGSGLVITELE